MVLLGERRVPSTSPSAIVLWNQIFSFFPISQPKYDSIISHFSYECDWVSFFFFLYLIAACVFLSVKSVPCQLFSGAVTPFFPDLSLISYMLRQQYFHLWNSQHIFIQICSQYIIYLLFSYSKHFSIESKLHSSFSIFCSFLFLSLLNIFFSLKIYETRYDGSQCNPYSRRVKQEDCQEFECVPE